MQESGNRSGWADWLCALERELGEPGADWLNRIAYQVIDRARLSRGQVVADLGAGTGLVALRAAKEVGPSGEVLAVDSSGALLVANGTAYAGLDSTSISALNDLYTFSGVIANIDTLHATPEFALAVSGLA